MPNSLTTSRTDEIVNFAVENNIEEKDEEALEGRKDDKQIVENETLVAPCECKEDPSEAEHGGNGNRDLQFPNPAIEHDTRLSETKAMCHSVHDSWSYAFFSWIPDCENLMALATNMKKTMLLSSTMHTGAMKEPKNQPVLEIQQLQQHHSMRLVCLSVSPYVCLSLCMSVCLSKYLSAHLHVTSDINTTICLNICNNCCQNNQERNPYTITHTSDYQQFLQTNQSRTYPIQQCCTSAQPCCSSYQTLSLDASRN